MRSRSEGDLYFETVGYFWEISGRRFAMPQILTPRKTLLCYGSDHPAQFDIRINIMHSPPHLMEPA